jgi:hypothetical protein
MSIRIKVMQTWVQSLVAAEFFRWNFERFQLVFLMVKSDLKDNKSPGTIACAVIPRLGNLTLYVND